MKKITHAVIPVAGFGTRMLPLSKSVPKELLPLGNRPAIHYVVEEAIAAGIKHIVLVGHSQKSAIENYFDINAELDNQLRQKGKDELADSLNWLPDDVSVSMIRQGKALGLGHAVLAARPIIGDNDFAVRLTTTLTITNGGNYTFNVGSDDGSRLYIDGVEIVENDGLQAFDTASGSVNLSLGQHEIVIIYF